MRERLDEVERMYEDLGRELADPNVAASPDRLRSLGRRHAELEEIVRAYRSYRRAVVQAEEAALLARGERDPEMVEYLRSE